MATVNRRKGYSMMTESRYREIKKDIPNHPKLSKKQVRLAEYYHISPTTMAKITKSRNWADYQDITAKLNIHRKQNETMPLFKASGNGGGSNEAPKEEAAKKTIQTRADAVDDKPKSVQAIAAAVAHSVVEREMANRAVSAAVVIKWAPGIDMKTSVSNGVTIIDAKLSRSHIIIKLLAVAMIVAGALILLLPFVAR